MKILEFDSLLPDKRIDRRKLHSSTDIVFITIAAVVCGAQSWEDIEEFGHCKEYFSGKYCLYPMAFPPMTLLTASFPVCLLKYRKSTFVFGYRPFVVKNPAW